MGRNRHTFQRKRRIDLGLAIMAATVAPGTKLDLRQIAIFAGCTHQAISCIEKKAIGKLRAVALELDRRQYD